MKAVSYMVIVMLIILGYRVSMSPEWQAAIGATVTGLIKPLLVPLVLLIAVPAFVYVVSTLLLLAAVIACVVHWFMAVRPRIRQIRMVIRNVADLPLPLVGEVDIRWSDVARRLGGLLRDNAIFVSAWSEFQAQSAQSGGIPAAPFSHFVASEPKARDRDGLMLALPGYFTSLGLIFTFIGLVVALYFAAKGFRSGNIEDARAAIIQLLNAASFKFLTSVAALISAMGVSLFLRFAQSAISRRLVDLAERIEGVISIWRENEGTAVAGDLRSTDLAWRFTALMSEVQTLTHAIESLVRRDGVRLAEPDHAAR